MSDITIACPRCCGTGRTELPRVLPFRDLLLSIARSAVMQTKELQA